MFNSNKIDDYIISLFVIIVFTFFMICISRTSKVGAAPSSSQVQLEVNNPYSLQVNVEIKCDWDPDIEEWMFHRFIQVPGKKMTVVSIPNKLKNCQLWPKIKFLNQ